jgi:NAD-dependent SIR2 family protein deacetylase
MIEVCKSPWHKKCKNTDIKAYITGRNLPVCSKCFEEIMKKDYVWDEETKIFK